MRKPRLTLSEQTIRERLQEVVGLLDSVRLNLLPVGVESHEVPIGHSLLANVLKGALNCTVAALRDLDKRDAKGRNRLDPTWTTEEEYQEALRAIREEKAKKQEQ